MRWSERSQQILHNEIYHYNIYCFTFCDENPYFVSIPVSYEWGSMMKNKSEEVGSMQADVTAQIEKALSNDKIVIRSFYMIVSTSLVFGILGAAIGWILAIFTPAYVRQTYDVMESEVWQIGVGAGMKWGLICGVIAACSVLLATAWYRSRMAKALTQQVEQQIGNADG